MNAKGRKVVFIIERKRVFFAYLFLAIKCSLQTKQHTRMSVLFLKRSAYL